MNTTRLLFSFFFAIATSLAMSQENEKPQPSIERTYNLNFAGVEAGPSLYPLNKPYGRFTEEEKASLRRLYVDMPPTDEPPFPKDGFLHIIRDLGEYANRLKQPESVSIAVMINESGEATSVRLLQYKNLETAKAVAYFLVKERYKPGRCGGTPCKMEFPFRLRLVP